MQTLLEQGASKIVLFDLGGERAYSEQDRQQYIPAGVTIFETDPIMNNLEDCGITNFTTPCQTQPQTCDYSAYWDAIGYPISGVHKALAFELEAQLSEVPVPAAA